VGADLYDLSRAASISSGIAGAILIIFLICVKHVLRLTNCLKSEAIRFGL
jgi:hypothetical protein